MNDNILRQIGKGAFDVGAGIVGNGIATGNEITTAVGGVLMGAGLAINIPATKREHEFHAGGVIPIDIMEGAGIGLITHAASSIPLNEIGEFQNIYQYGVGAVLTLWGKVTDCILNGDEIKSGVRKTCDKLKKLVLNKEPEITKQQ